MAWNASSASMLVAYDGQADAPDHRLVPLDQGREGQLGRLVGIGRESFQELAVGQVPDGPEIIEGSELTKYGPVPSSDYHDVCPQPVNRLDRGRRPGIGRLTIMSRGARMVLDPRDIFSLSPYRDSPPVKELGTLTPGSLTPIERALRLMIWCAEARR